MRRIFGAVLALAMIVSMTLIASAGTGSVEVRGHIVGADAPVAQYRITYYANGGRGGYNGPDVTAGSADTVCSLSRTGITRYGFRFTGWNTREDGRGTPYAAGDSITMNGNVTLYAQWSKITEGGGNGTRSPDDGQTPWSGGTIALNDVPKGDGATTSSDGMSSPNPNTGAINNMPLYAGLLFASLGMIMFLLWADRIENARNEV